MRMVTADKGSSICQVHGERQGLSAYARAAGRGRNSNSLTKNDGSHQEWLPTRHAKYKKKMEADTGKGLTGMRCCAHMTGRSPLGP